MKTFTVKSNATRAARKACAAAGCPDATAGVDFFIIESGDTFAFTLAAQWRPNGPSEDDALTPGVDTPAEVEAETDPVLAEVAAGREILDAPDDDAEALGLADTLAGLDDLDVTALAATPAPGATPEAAAKEKPLGKRAQAKAAAEAAAATGELPPHLTIASAANPSYNKRADAIRALAEAGDITGLKAATFTGQNTYAAMLRRYHALLVTATEAALAKIGGA